MLENTQLVKIVWNRKEYGNKIESENEMKMLKILCLVVGVCV